MKIYYLLLIVILHSSCIKIIGLRNANEKYTRNINKTCNRYKIPISDNYILDTAKYNYIQSKYINENSNYQQPLQIIVFDKNKTKITSLINCNVGGFPFLKWNRFNNFNQVPINQGKFTFSENKITKDEIDNCISSNLKKVPQADFDFYYYIFWSRTTHRNTIRLIKMMKENLKTSGSLNVKVHYVFVDKLYL
jgi:hypothetical protein